MNKPPFEVGLIDFIPLRNRLIISTLSSLDVDIFSRMHESNVPIFTSRRFEGHLEVTLVSVCVLVPSGNFTTVVVVCPKLVHNIGRVDFAGNEEMSRGGCRFNVPFEVILVHPSPSGDFGTIGGLSAKNMQKSTNLALNGEGGAISVLCPVGRSSGVSSSVTGGEEPPFKVGLVDFIPLSDWSVVGRHCSLHVHIFATVDKLDKPGSVMGRFESNLDIGLVSVSGFVPKGDLSTVVLISS